jgi:phospholipase C
MDPIRYGDIVGLLHPGTYSRISPKYKSKEFLQFTVLGGEEGSEVPNGGIIALSQSAPDEYSLLSPEQKWKVTFNGDGPLHSGARVKLDAIPEGSREHQLYLIYRLTIDPIEHVVLLMMENRSFFRVYGYMDPKKDTYVNYSESGKEFRSGPSDDLETPDPPHEIPFVNISLAGEKPDGYVKAYEKYHKERGTPITDADLQDVMGYTKKGFLPALHKMEHFASICSQWYCSLRGPTWPNRMYALSGTCFGWKTTPEMNPKILTELKDFLKEWHAFKPIAPQKFSIYDILDEKKVSYNIYTDTPLEFTLSGDVFYPAIHDDDMDEFRKDAKDGTLPNFSFIEPNFVHMPNFGFIQNDDHPPANPLKAQKFIADVYNTLRESPKWKNTLLVVTYDEHGGFFDPVVPPKAPVPDAASKDEANTFGFFGVRVPTVLVSPCIKQGIDDAVYDHTSVLKYVLNKWAPESVNSLGERVKYANSLPTIRDPRPLDSFPPITDEDFLPLIEHREANNKEVEPQAPDRKLPLHESAQIAVKDHDVEQKLRTIIVNKRLAKAAPGVAVAQGETEPQIQVQAQEIHNKEQEKEHKDENVVVHLMHEIKDGVDFIASKIGGLLLSHPSEPHAHSHHAHSHHASHAQDHSHTTHPSHPTSPEREVVPPKQQAAAAATLAANPAARVDAERYADEVLQAIHQGVDPMTVTDEQKSRDLMANQIRAVGMYSEKSCGSNDLARSYLQLMQVRAKKYTKKKANKQHSRLLRTEHQ